jgi:hypothetical protein
MPWPSYTLTANIRVVFHANTAFTSIARFALRVTGDAERIGIQ